MAAGQHRDGAGRQARAMRGGVDAARQPRDDDEAGVAEFARECVAANFMPAAEALREPTMATIGCARRASLAAHREQRRRDRRSSATAPDNPARRARPSAMPRVRAGFQFALRLPRSQIYACRTRRRAAPAPAALRARARAPPYVDQSRKVRGPTLSLRMRRSQSSRCSSVSFTPSPNRAPVRYREHRPVGSGVQPDLLEYNRRKV